MTDFFGLSHRKFTSQELNQIAREVAFTLANKEDAE